MKLNKFQKGLPVVILELADKYELTLQLLTMTKIKIFGNVMVNGL